MFYTAVSTAFPLVTGMRPVRGITAGGSRITFYGRRLDAFPPLGAYFIPSNDTGLPALYGFAHSRSEALKWKSFLAQFARGIGAGGRGNKGHSNFRL